MSKQIAISVTEDHIANGLRYSCYRCPIALAMEKTLRPDFLSVGDDLVTIGANARGVRPAIYLITDEMREFIGAFDCGLEVHPVTFFLDVQTEAPR